MIFAFSVAVVVLAVVGPTVELAMERPKKARAYSPTQLQERRESVSNVLG